MYRVHVGYTCTGRDRWRRFADLESAKEFCALIFQATRIVLCIERD